MSTVNRVHEKIIVAKGYFVKDLESAVFKATKRNSKAPKWKHVSILLNATWRRDISISDIGHLLEERLRDTSWSVVFKTLIVTHILMDQGSGDRLIGYLSTQPSVLYLANFRDSSGARIEQAKNIQRYAAYLEEKVHIYRDMKKDYCRPASPSKQSADSYGSMNRDAHLPTDVARAMRTAPVNEFFMKEMSAVLRQLQVLLKANFAYSEIDNEVTLSAFKLLLRDLMRLYNILNEGMINLLQRISDLPFPLAKQGVALFRQMLQQTRGIDVFLATAREFPSGVLQISIPEFKHIPDIADALEQDLERMHNGGISGASSPTPSQQYATASRTTDSPVMLGNPAHDHMMRSSPIHDNPSTAPKKPSALIDFFDAIEDNSHQFQLAQQNTFDPFANNGFVPAQQTGTSYATSTASPFAAQQNFVDPFSSQQSQQSQPQAAAFDPFSSNSAASSVNPFTSQDQQQPAFQPFGQPNYTSPFASQITSAAASSPFNTNFSMGTQSTNVNPFAQSSNAFGITSTGSTLQPTGTSAAFNPFGASTSVNVNPTGMASSNPFSNVTNQSTGVQQFSSSQPAFSMAPQTTGFPPAQPQSTGFSSTGFNSQPTGFAGQPNPFAMPNQATLRPLSNMSSTTGPYGTPVSSSNPFQQQPQQSNTGMAIFGGPGGTRTTSNPGSQHSSPNSNYVATSNSMDPFTSLDPLGSKAQSNLQQMQQPAVNMSQPFAFQQPQQTGFSTNLVSNQGQQAQNQPFFF